MIWKELYSDNSASDHGTLYQLRNVMHRRNVSNMPKRNVNASEDFFNVAVASHVVAAAMHIMGTASLSSPPETLDSECFQTVCEEVVNRYVSFRQLPGAVEDQPSDGVLAYASKTLTLGLVYLEFADAIKESDSDRLQRCWRYLLVLFRSTGRRNYAFESLNLLYQCLYSVSPRVAQHCFGHAA